VSAQQQQKQQKEQRLAKKKQPQPQQRKRLKVDPSFIVDKSSPPVEEDDHIRHLDQSGALAHVFGSQSLLSQELNEYNECCTSFSSSQKKPVNMNEAEATLLTSEELEAEEIQAQKVTPSIVREEVEEPPMSSSQLSFLIGAARALESDSEDDSYETPGEEEEEEEIVSGKHVSQNRKPGPPKSPTKTRARLPLATKPLPSTKNPATTKRPPPSKTCATSRSPPTTISTKSPPPAGKMTSPTVANKTATTATTGNAPQQGVSRKEMKKMEKVAQQNQARTLAQQAASLAAQAIASPEVSKQLLLSMVFVRTNPRSPPATWPARGSTIPEGFFWATYPPLETTLKRHMKRYYELSVKKCQSKEQQAFNNDMVTVVKVEASKYEWAFSPKFSDKGLRDRVRCYFKTHIQNAKKRLRTMLMNPTKRANTKALINHLDMIQTYSQKEKVTCKSSKERAIPQVECQGEAQVATSPNVFEPINDSQSSDADLDPDTRDAVQQVVRTIALF
jgi:hypothetical protein